MTSRSFQTATHTPSAHTGGHTTRTGGATGGAAAATATHTAGFTSAADDDLFGFLDGFVYDHCHSLLQFAHEDFLRGLSV